MKKQVFLFLVLAVLVAGGVFAQTDIKSKIELFNPENFPITIVSATLQPNTRELKVTYSASQACGVVRFFFKVRYIDYYDGNKSWENTHSIMNFETILWARNSSTFTFTLPEEVAYRFTRLGIDLSKLSS